MQTKIDLVPEGPDKQVWAIEIKKSVAPNPNKGFYTACEDVGATQKFVIYSGTERFPIARAVEAIGLIAFLKMLEEKSNPAQGCTGKSIFVTM